MEPDENFYCLLFLSRISAKSTLCWIIIHRNTKSNNMIYQTKMFICLQKKKIYSSIPSSILLMKESVSLIDRVHNGAKASNMS